MAYELRDNSGSLFRNQKRIEENHPNATGKCMVGGITYYVSAWTKTATNGDKWQSLSFKPVDEAKRTTEKKPENKGDFEDFESDIPW